MSLSLSRLIDKIVNNFCFRERKNVEKTLKKRFNVAKELDCKPSQELSETSNYHYYYYFFQKLYMKFFPKKSGKIFVGKNQ